MPKTQEQLLALSNATFAYQKQKRHKDKTSPNPTMNPNSTPFHYSALLYKFISNSKNAIAAQPNNLT